MTAQERSFPCLCRFSQEQFAGDPVFGMAGKRGGFFAVAVGADADRLRLVVSAAGEELAVDPVRVTFGVRAESALAVMDALEEAIEDARDELEGDPTRPARLERTLALIERCLDDDQG